MFRTALFSFALALFAFPMISLGQDINWRAMDGETDGIFHVAFGYDFGVVTQLGYHRSLSWGKSIVVGLDYSFPMGSEIADDFKIRLGAQSELVRRGDFSITAGTKATFRRHETSLVRMAGFGAEVVLIGGLYRRTWHIAAEFGFDKSVIVNLGHSEIATSTYPDITSGWFMPAGGYFHYGLQAGKSVGAHLDLLLKLGATNAQGQHADPLLPVYARLGMSRRF